MDVKQLWNYYLVVIFLMVFDKGICFEEDYDESPNFGRCPWIRNKLKNGRVKIRSRGRIAKFLCDSGYELAGKRFATCVRGQWNNPIPVCVARGCPRTPVAANGRVTEMYRGAMLVYDCNPGYSLDGVVSIYCDGRKWSTDPPACVVATSDPEVKCDFEDPELCGWSHDPTHDFDWKRNQFSTPSGHVGTGPHYDHTFGYDKGGFYLYLEASSPRKENDKARLFSPVYPPDDSDSCFVFWYHMYGAHIGTLNVYLKPESHVFSELSPNWEKSGDHGQRWIRGTLDIPSLNENFQIVIEGVRGDGYIGDISLDDVQLVKSHCGDLENATDSVSHTIAESCRGRCGRYREKGDNSSCGCSANCQTNDTCCNDYATICIGKDTVTEGTEDIIPDSELGKTSTFVSMTATNEVSMEPSPEPTSSPSTSRDVSRSSTVNETTSSITASMTPVTFTLSTASSTSETTSITLPTMESNAMNSSIASQLTSISVAVDSPSTTSNFSNPPREEAVPVTSTSISSVLPTTVQTTTTTVQSTTSATTVKPTTSTTTIKPTVTTSTVKSTTDSTTVKLIATTTTAISTTLVTENITTPNQTTKITTIQTDVSKEEDAISYSSHINISPVLSTTGSTVYATIVNSSEEANIPYMHSYQTDGTIASSSSESSSITSTFSTRKSYNLRPRTQRTTISISRAIPSSTSTYSRNTAGVTYISAMTTLKNSVVTDTRARTSSKSWVEHISQNIPNVVLITKSTQSLSKTSHSNTLAPSYPRTTRKFTFGIRGTTKSTLTVVTTTDSSLNHASKEASTADKDSQPTVAIVAVLVAVIAFAAGGLMYYLKKQKDRRRSKLSDDSEMRFLSDNEEMEYSDASVLDKILMK